MQRALYNQQVKHTNKRKGKGLKDYAYKTKISRNMLKYLT